MRDAKRMKQRIHPLAVALLAAILTAVVTVCADPGGNPTTPEIPGDTVARLNGDAIEGWHVGAVAADGGDDDDTFTCTSARDCYQKCEKRLEKDGDSDNPFSSTTCECVPGDAQWLCEIKHGLGEGGDTGEDGKTGDGCSDGGKLPTDTLRDGNEGCIVDVRIDCGGYNEPGDRVTCVARTTWDGRSVSQLYDWTSGSNGKTGWNSIGKFWEGRALKSKGVTVFVQVELDDTLLLNRTHTKVQVHPRREWNLNPGSPAQGSPKKHPQSWPEPYRRWGVYGSDIEKPEAYSPGTIEGTGPWAGDGYIAARPPEVRARYLYWRPDIRLKNGIPTYAGAKTGTCDNNGLPKKASMLDVNKACKTDTAFKDWYWQIFRHEWKHHTSLADCGNALFQSGEVGKMESFVAEDANKVTGEVEKLYKRDVFNKLLTARESKQETIYSDSLWLAPWVKNNWAYGRAGAKGHNGTNGC